MRKSVRKKQSLFPLEYDEVSLVDEGAAGTANVLIMKRNKKREEGSHMAVEVVTKKKGGLTCGDCGESVSKSAAACPKCESTNVQKSLIVVRKAVGTKDDDLEKIVAETDDEPEEDDELEDDDEEVDELEDEDDNDDDDDDDDDEDEDDEDDDEDVPSVKKSFSGPEILNIATAIAADVSKALSGSTPRKSYESVMQEANDTLDAAVDVLLTGKSSVAKSKRSSLSEEIQKRVDRLLNKKGTAVRKSAKKSEITKRADLPEDVRKSLEASDKIVERETVRQYEEVAKGFEALPGDKVELAKSLRAIAEHAGDDAYKTQIEALTAANDIAKQSEIFKAFGAPGGGEPTDAISKRHAAAVELVAKGDFKSVEAAEVSLMNGETSYTPTNV